MKSRKLIVVMVCVAVLAMAIRWVYFNLQIDSCLDGGGRWSEEKSECEYR